MIHKEYVYAFLELYEEQKHWPNISWRAWEKKYKRLKDKTKLHLSDEESIYCSIS